MSSPEIFSASTSDVRPLASVLRSLSFKKTAIVQIRADGIKVTVEEARSIQANAYLQSTSFKTYSYDPPPPTTIDEDDEERDQLQDEEEEEEEPISAFQISLSTVLECLNIFGNAGSSGIATASGGASDSSGGGNGGKYNRFHRDDDNGEGSRGSGKMTSLRMSYAGHGEPLILLLEEEGIVTRCEITTYEPEQLMELPFYDEHKIQKLIMKSEWLRDAFQEIDQSSEKVTLTFSPAEYNPTPYNRYAKLTAPSNKKKKNQKKKKNGNRTESEDEDQDDDAVNNDATPTFRLESTGDLGSTEMDYPNDRDVLELFECDHLCRNSYKFSHISFTTKALNASTKTSIRTSAEGLISFQFMIPLSRGKGGESKDAFVEFLCVPLDE